MAKVVGFEQAEKNARKRDLELERLAYALNHGGIPHVIYAGDKDNVNEALQVMFHKAMKMPLLRDLPDKLF